MAMATASQSILSGAHKAGSTQTRLIGFFVPSRLKFLHPADKSSDRPIGLSALILRTIVPRFSRRPARTWGAGQS